MRRNIILLITLFAILVVCPVCAYADTYNNNAFIGDWYSQNATDTDYARLHIDYCDSSVIQCHFEDVSGGVPKYIYKLYEGKVNDNKATLHFDLLSTEDKSYMTSGSMELAWFIDNIWLSAYSAEGDTLYSNMLLPSKQSFNPYASPYSYDLNLELNGQTLTPDAKPLIINSRSYVPLRGIFDAMGINVYWDSYQLPARSAQMITAAYNSSILQLIRSSYNYGFGEWEMSRLTADDPNTYYGGNTEIIDISDVQPIIINSSTYVPLRVIAESFGAQIEWIDSSRTVQITFDTNNSVKKTADEIKEFESFTPEKAADTASGYTVVYTNPHPFFAKGQKFYEVIVQNGYPTKNIFIYSDGHIE